MSNSEKNFLDYNGLSHYDENIKEYIPITHGYYNDGNFYSDSSFTELITGEEKRLYVDLADDGLYEYKNNEYVPFSGGGGTTNYNNLNNKPKINNVELSGNKTSSDLSLAASDHTHNIDLAADSGTSSLDLSAGTNYKITAGGESFVFKTPPTPSASDVGAIASSVKGVANGVAELDANGFVPSAQLPSFVDDIIEGYLYDGKFYKESTHITEITGETGKVYVDLATDTTYRWSGTAFVQIKGDLALGETSSTAYRGDRGKTAYDHSQSTHARTDATKTEASATNGNIKINGTETTVYTHPGSGTNPHGTTASDVGLGNVGNFKAVSTVASQGLTDTEKSNARANIGAGTSSLTIGSTASTAAAGNHTHGLSLATDTGTSSISLAANTKYKLTAGGSTYIFTTPPDNNTTYESKAAASGGTAVSLVTTGEKYTWNNKSNLAIGTTASTAAAGNHTHTTSLATDSGTATVTLARNTTYKLTAGGTNVIFKTPASDNTNNRRGFWGTCATAAATAEKAVTLGSTAGWELVAGTIVGVKFTNTNTAGTVKLNVNSSGAKQIWYNGAAYTGTEARITGWAGHTIYYIYDGTYWEFLNNDANYINTNTTYSAGTGLSLSGTTFSIDNSTISPYEEKIQWGGGSVSGGISPLGASLSSEHNCNRLAFINGAALTFEYSSNGGSSYTNYGYSAADKSAFCTTSYEVRVGRTSGNYTTSSRTRITLTAQNGTTGYVYTRPKKLLINVSTSGGMNVLIEYRTGTNYKNNGAWTTFGTYALSGWSGWNDIPLILDTLGGSTSQTGNNWQLRLTFIMTSVNSSYPSTASLYGMRLFGDTGWTTTSNMGATGHLYSYDISQNATFPAKVSAGSFDLATTDANNSLLLTSSEL